MLHTLYAIVDNAEVNKHYWGPNGWTMFIEGAFLFLTNGSADLCKEEEELSDCIIEPIELD